MPEQGVELENLGSLLEGAVELGAGDLDCPALAELQALAGRPQPPSFQDVWDLVFRIAGLLCAFLSPCCEKQKHTHRGKC